MLGPLIAAGSTLLGGFLGRQHQDEMIEREHQRQDTSIQRRVADSRAAGIHPLYGLGASVSSPSVSVGSDPLASSLSSMGQDLSRAARATQTGDQREGTGVLHSLALERAGLQNELLRSQIASMNARTSQGGQVGPPIPADSPEPFPVPEENKSEQRPPLMLFGQRWNTNPNTSPMKAWENQYGDEGPIAWGMPIALLVNDLKHNSDHNWHPDKWVENTMSWLDRAANRHMNGKETAQAERFLRYMWHSYKGSK